eukprot:CAMPEP_0174263728 /NCGR_PEP_ID=MMETSP0439-20130205/19826_1 /TAXON_ID=0 /ORGANISM="Stereomyxa ramosa, Strain Chinc5" /LENGTH=284 /DNA_ID=CAMNT_0015349239 /DNA_START=312 /DNA_END=1163 /DNA_ORIENTATION=-
MIAIDHQKTFEEAFQILSANKISSAPVFDSNSNTLGLLDTSDLVVFIMNHPRPSLMEEFTNENPELNPFTKNVGEMVGKSGNPFIFFQLNTPIFEAILTFAKGHRRACILDNNGYISWILTQFSILSYLNDNALELFGSFLKNKVIDLSIIVPKVLCVETSEVTGRALAGLIKCSVSGIAVIDSKHRLKAEFSTQTLKGITKDTFSDLYLPVSDFLRKYPDRNSEKPITCGPKITLGELLKLIVKEKCHRVWVVSAMKQKLLGVITLSSVIASLSDKKKLLFQC